MNNRYTSRGIVRREAILRATKKLLLEKEIQQIRVKDIAKSANIPISSIYNLFDDLDDIYTNVVSDIWTDLIKFRKDRLRDRYTCFRELSEHSTRINFEFVMKNELARKTLHSNVIPESIKNADKHYIVETIREFLLQYFPALTEPEFERNVELMRKQILIFDALIADILSDTDKLAEEHLDEILELILKIST